MSVLYAKTSSRGQAARTRESTVRSEEKLFNFSERTEASRIRAAISLLSASDKDPVAGLRLDDDPPKTDRNDKPGRLDRSKIAETAGSLRRIGDLNPGEVSDLYRISSAAPSTGLGESSIRVLARPQP
jgi:hypothetical protein